MRCTPDNRGHGCTARAAVQRARFRARRRRALPPIGAPVAADPQWLEAVGRCDFTSDRFGLQPRGAEDSVLLCAL